MTTAGGWRIADDLEPRPRYALGREQELEHFEESVASLTSGAGIVTLLEGEEGIGKTTLADAFAAIASRHGVTPVWGRCWSGGGAPAFWPWVQLLRGIAELPHCATQVAALGPRAAPLLALVPELRPDAFADVTAAPSPSADARFALFDMVARLLRAMAKKTPLLLVLDDIHEADPASLLLLRFVARELRSMSCSVVVTYRPVEARQREEVAAALAEVTREGTVLVLEGLAQADLFALVTQLTDQRPSPQFVRSLHAVTDGNPFFTAELVRLLRAEDRLGDPLDGPFPVPLRAQETVEQRVSQLAEPVQAVLAVAAVIGRELDLALLASATDLPLERLIPLLEDAASYQLLQRASARASHYTFVHSLTREAVYHRLTEMQRAELHARVGEAILKSDLGNAEGRLAELAHHFCAASVLDGGKRGYEYALRAGDAALGVLAYEQAIPLYRQALAIEAGVQPTDEQRVHLLLGFGTALLKSGDVEGGRERFTAAAEIARRMTSPTLFARAALAYGDTPVEGGIVNATLVALLEEALQRLPEEPNELRASVLARLAHELLFSPDRERRMELAREALTMARDVGSVRTLASVLVATAGGMQRPDDPEEPLALTAELVRLGMELRDAELEAHGWARHANWLLYLAHSEELHVAWNEIERLAREVGVPQLQWFATMTAVVRANLRGDLAGMETAMQAGLAFSGQVANAMGAYVTQLVVLRLWTEWDPGLDGLPPMMTETRPGLRSVWRAGIAWLHASTARTAQAGDELAALVDELPTLPRDGQYLMTLSFLVEAARMVNDVAAAEQLYEAFLPYAGRIVYTSMVLPTLCHGPVDFYLGALARLSGRLDDADHHLRAARSTAARIGHEMILARALAEQAAVLLARGQPADTDAAGALFDEAAQAAERFGFTFLARDVERLRDEHPHAAAAVPPEVPAPEMVREGEYWTVRFGTRTSRFKDSKGMTYLLALLSAPEREVHVLELVSAVAGTRASQRVKGDRLLSAVPDSDAGEVLDATAKAAYRARLEELQDELLEAESFNDSERAARAREEMDFLVEELSRAVGLGGRDRRTGSQSELARASVTKALKRLLERIAAADPELGRHLHRTIRTGTFCGYLSEVEPTCSWRISSKPSPSP